MRLSDLEPKTEIEVRCCLCHKHRYETARDLMIMGRFGQYFLDELEAALSCRVRTCGGAVRLALVYDDLNEGFVGGMA